MDDDRRCIDRRGEVSICFVVYAEIGLVPHFPFVGPFDLSLVQGLPPGLSFNSLFRNASSSLIINNLLYSDHPS